MFENINPNTFTGKLIKQEGKVHTLEGGIVYTGNVPNIFNDYSFIPDKHGKLEYNLGQENYISFKGEWKYGIKNGEFDINRNNGFSAKCLFDEKGSLSEIISITIKDKESKLEYNLYPQYKNGHIEQIKVMVYSKNPDFKYSNIIIQGSISAKEIEKNNQSYFTAYHHYHNNDKYPLDGSLAELFRTDCKHEGLEKIKNMIINSVEKTKKPELPSLENLKTEKNNSHGIN